MKYLLFLLTVLASASVQAAEYTQVQADKSTVSFSYKQMGVAMDGKFRKFASQLRFDPAQPAKASATIDVDLASIDTGTTEADTEVAGKTWFNTKAFPVARFESKGVKVLAGNKYEITGTLTIKGKTLPVTLPVTFAAQGKTGVFEGSFTLRRGDYAIGEGSWSAFDIVANDIVVKFRITSTTL